MQQSLPLLSLPAHPPMLPILRERDEFEFDATDFKQNLRP